MGLDLYFVPEIVADQTFKIWSDQIASDPGVYWYEVDPLELWLLAENKEKFTDWKEASVRDLEKFIAESQEIQEDTFVYLPLMDLLQTAATWKELSQKPQISKRLLIISEAHDEISSQVQKSTDWRNIRSSIKTLRQMSS